MEQLSAASEKLWVRVKEIFITSDDSNLSGCYGNTHRENQLNW